MYQKKKINKTLMNFSDLNLLNKLTYFMLRKNLFIYLFAYLLKKT